MDIQHIIVQAGGKGTRLEHLTANKPKALVSIDGRPMLFHLFAAFPGARFIIIGDYKYDVLESYLAAFCAEDYTLVNARGRAKTCAGLPEALAHVPDGAPFLYIWSDLVLPPGFRLPETPGNYLGVATDFPCRWKYESGAIIDEPSSTHGIAGLFLFRDKSPLAAVPHEGAFVRWLSRQEIAFTELPLPGVREYGLLSSCEAVPACRPFNTIEMREDTVIKRPRDAQGRSLARREQRWYRCARELGLADLPEILAWEPLTMRRVNGRHPFELSRSERPAALEAIFAALGRIHAAKVRPADIPSLDEAYIGKTRDRLERVRRLIPFADRPELSINGRTCPNPLFHWEEVHALLAARYPARFSLIHGDCTFSNTLIEPDGRPVFIDPRGYFGHTELFGDPAYDYAKLWYSLAGNYDQFNRRNFRLRKESRGVWFTIAGNGWEDLGPEFRRLLPADIGPDYIRLLHGIIWLSLTTYVWDDYDSICCAFYMGALQLAEACCGR